MILTVAIVLIELHGPDGHRVEVNPAEVSSLREDRPSDAGLLAEGVNCVLGMTNGKFIAVVEDCAVVKRKLEE